jgi:cytokinin dehydrogenase
VSVGTSRDLPGLVEVHVPAPRTGSGAAGFLCTDPETITGAADDFGHLVHHVPAAVARPQTVTEVQRMVRYAAGAGMAIRPRGGGHSVSGQAQCDGGMVCDLTGMNQTWKVEDKRFKIPRVKAEAGARWSAVLGAALEHGLTPPVLTDYLELTVGGTLSAGGIGGTSHLYGPQVDNILRVWGVTPEGEYLGWSTSEGRFPAALAGQGNREIITNALIPLVPAPARVRVYRVPAPDAAALTAWQRQLATRRRCSYIEGQILATEHAGWQCILEAAAYDTGTACAQPDEAILGDLEISLSAVEVDDVDYLAFCNRMLPGVRQLAACGSWYRPHPWFSVFLPGDAVAGYVDAALNRLRPELVGLIPMLLYPLRRGPVPSPGLATPSGDADGLFWSFSILRTVADDADAITAALAENAELAQAAVAAGGTVYPIGT